MTAPLTVSAAASENGLVRQNNEDAAYAGRWLFAVAGAATPPERWPALR
jgi:hypothetical protein